MTAEQTAELDKWAAQSGERAAITEFLEFRERRRVLGLDNGKPSLTLEDLLDEFFEIDRVLLESARRTLLTESTGWTPPAFHPKEITS